MHNLFKTLAKVGHSVTFRPSSERRGGEMGEIASRSIHGNEGSAVTGMAASARGSGRPPGPSGRDGSRRRPSPDGEGGAPLTVAAVAARLGVAASTLRTWDRRYGLGPSSHEAGSHRRYTPADVARLERMRHLTLQGVAPSDAARAALSSDPAVPLEAHPWPRRLQESAAEEPAHHERLLVDPLSLAAAALEPDAPRVHRMLDQEVRDAGIVKAWTSLAKPALAMLSQRERSDRPGVDPEGVIATAVLTAVREVATAAERARESGVHLLRPGDGPTASASRTALLCAAQDRRLRAHVIGGGLAERGVRARVLRAESLGGPEQGLRTIAERAARVLAVVGNPPGTDELVRAVSARGDVEVFLLGGDAPDLWLPRVHRVRSALAAVEEIAGLMEE
ncbi:MerR family transcriptional regulator [Georgenia yuyongxinii]|uniref:MerR family transcriptional regulator n=1 Tax=Georgenia yuyongxinii TaxID=2589797 RepID=A0A5B8C8L5_9MICO|nr:MerR family transcriptional regulator [Georgenia yuyongxinii]